ncbi:MAG: class I SAM-dependent methyltransferase [Candidatus Hydromicrobium sp.]|nr:class I SAM-dependent methyltransferase [Candidatus Hydromicrobium sp.]
MIDNKTPHRSSEYDLKVRKTIPFYEFFHEETINLIKTIKPNVKKWLDTGCGTGFLIEKTAAVFKDCKFILSDPSSEMLMRAKKRLQDCKNVEYLDPIETENMKLVKQKEYDVITAIQTHHYLNREDRIKATDNCYKLLKDNGIYVTFENIRPENDGVLDFQLDRWMNFQLLEGRSKRAVAEHRKRFGVKYFPIRVSEHLELLNSIGFKIVEIFWMSYLQAGFFCIK